VTPWRALIRSEWRLACRQRTLWLAASGLVLAVVAGVASGAAGVRRNAPCRPNSWSGTGHRWAALETELVRADRGDGTSVRGRHPGAPAWLGQVGRHATLPPSGLGVLSVGELAHHASQVHVTVDSLDTLLGADAVEPAALLVGGWIDTGFVVVVVLPLFLLTVMYDVVAAERERGTLALILAQPVSPSRAVLAKLGVRAGVMVAIVVGATVAGLRVTGTDLTDWAVLGRLLGWVVSVGLYSAFWCALALVVNTGRGSSAANAVACVGVWLGVVVLVPSAIDTLARLVYPTPARAELVVAVRDAAGRLEPEAREILARRDAAHPELRPSKGRRVADRAALQYAVLQAQEEELRPLLARFDAQRRRRHTLLAWFRPLSPALTLQAVVDNLAGTGPDRYGSFLRQVADYHRAWRAFFLGRVYRGEPVSLADYAHIPRFSFAGDPRPAWSPAVRSGLLALLGAVIVTSLVAMHRMWRAPWFS
jgi:ABC-2 type transport system permease protein